MALSKKEWLAMQNEWVRSMNPSWYISQSDCRIGCKYAIVCNYKAEVGFGTQVLTEFLTRQEWFIMRNTINICGEEAFRKGLEERMYK